MHRATAESGDTVYRIQCLTCGTDKAYKDPTEKKASTKKKVTRVVTPPKEGVRVAYDMRKVYFAGDVMVHPTFGEGEILSVVNDIATCSFPKGKKMLMTNRR